MRRLLLAGFFAPALAAQAADFDIDEMLAAHNRWRQTVHVSPLAYSATLAASAQEWANHLQQSNHCQMQHSQPEGRYGENLFWASALRWSDGRSELQTVSPKQVVDDWGNERADYNYRTNSCAKGKMCGHYTQVIWSTTSTVGCAFAVCTDTHEQVWVCQYQTPGNWLDKRPY